jgi:hypothetical protein
MQFILKISHYPTDKTEFKYSNTPFSDKDLILIYPELEGLSNEEIFNRIDDEISTRINSITKYFDSLCEISTVINKDYSVIELHLIIFGVHKSKDESYLLKVVERFWRTILDKDAIFKQKVKKNNIKNNTTIHKSFQKPIKFTDSSLKYSISNLLSNHGKSVSPDGRKWNEIISIDKEDEIVENIMAIVNPNIVNIKAVLKKHNCDQYVEEGTLKRILVHFKFRFEFKSLNYKNKL